MLNDNQVKIMKINEKRVFVVSGAGTGKTTIIFHRIKYLIDQKVDIKSILVISFTRRTINDLKMKFVDSADNPVIKTFHGLAFLHFGCHDLKSTEQAPSHLFEEFDEQTLSQIVTKKGVLTFMNVISKPLSRYNTILRQNGLFDYADLELAFLQRMKDLTFLKHLQTTYAYIFIDESQDMSFIQFKILQRLVNRHTFIFLVGDPDQSIYRFRGSRSQMTKHLIRSFGCHTLTLEDNYRSCTHILDLANTLIKHNHNRIKKVLIPHRNTVGICEFHQFSNTKKEADFIYTKITHFLHQKYTQKDIVILVRNHFQANEIKRLLQMSYYRDVDCLSIHQSKGLEFKIVLLIGIEEIKVKKRLEIEEERRLFFVAITRAKDVLIMTSPQNLKVPRFVKETGILKTKH
jgi:DNA helicase II / ATP-dependent DNA helicase PcrA